MTNNTTIASIMTTTPVVANKNHKFSQVLRLFTEFGVHHLPIVDESDRLIGIISSNDIAKVFIRLTSRTEPLTMTMDNLDNEVNLMDLMTPYPVTISSTDSVAIAARIFAQKKFAALPVVDNGTTLVGILSIKDVVTYLDEVEVA